MKDSDFAYAVARVRSIDSRLLTATELESLLASGGEKNTLNLLSQKGWSTGENMLSEEQERLWAFINEIAPAAGLFDPLLISNDFHNLKAALKCAVSDNDPERLFLTPSVYDPSGIYESIKKREFDALPECMRQCAEEAYTALLERSDSQKCDCAVDRALIEYSLTLAKKAGGLLEKVFSLRAVTAGFKTAYRLSSQGKGRDFILSALPECNGADREALAAAAADGTEAVIETLSRVDKAAAEALSTSPGEFEKYMDEKELALCREVRHEIFGADPLTAYILLTQSDIRNVRIILTAQRNGIPSVRARAMLRTAG